MSGAYDKMTTKARAFVDRLAGKLEKLPEKRIPEEDVAKWCIVGFILAVVVATAASMAFKAAMKGLV